MLTVSIPKLYQNLVDKKIVGIEHAALNTRLYETVLAIAISKSGWQSAKLIVPDLGKIKLLLHKWGIKSKSIASCVIVDNLYITDKADIPFECDQLYALDCHLLESCPGVGVFVGIFCERTHWFYNYCRQHPNVRYDALQIADQFPDQAKNLLSKKHPEYDRLMLLKDVESKVNTNFLTFASSRLKVRTDKDFLLLSAKQQKEIEGQYGVSLVSFDLTRLQKRYLAYKRLVVNQGKKPWFILLKYRRGGFTTLEQAISYRLCVERPRSAVTTLAHILKSTKRIFKIVETFRECDPYKLSLKSETSEELEFNNGSFFFIGTAGSKGFARGDTLQRVHGSEVAKWCEGPNQFELVNDLAAGILGAAGNGEVVLESTPNGHEWFAQTYKDAKNGLNEFIPVFLPWFFDPINRLRCNVEEIIDTLQNEEIELVEKYQLTAEQLAFRRQEKRKYKTLFFQEMPEDDTTCFLTSGMCFFDVERLLFIVDSITENGFRRHIPGGEEIIWEEPIPGIDYVAGVDTSEGLIGSDRNGIGIIRKDTGTQVASVHGLFSPRILAEHICRICTKYNNALVGIERQNHGHAVIQKVIELGYRSPHYSGGSLFYYTKDKPGWDTTSITRPLMLDQLAEAIEDNGMIIKDKEFIGECFTFRKQSSGKYAADSGAYDDRVIKWAIAWQMIMARRPKTSRVTTSIYGRSFEKIETEKEFLERKRRETQEKLDAVRSNGKSVVTSDP